MLPVYRSSHQFPLFLWRFPPMPRHSYYLHAPHGFTLLEMVLVLFLMGLIASATFMLTENVEDQTKYEETQRRLEIMRQAIIGSPSQTLNQTPRISGFVADMGRLPACLHELLEPTDCNGGALPTWPSTPDASTGLFYGWHGPYIQVLPERNGALRFRDGYGNTDASDAQNSGWQWLISDSANASDAILQVQSAGTDGLFGTADDYPSGSLATTTPLVTESAHIIHSTQLSGRIRFLDLSTAIPATTLFVRIHYPDGNGATLSVDSDGFIIDASTASLNGGYSPTITFSNTASIPIGVRTIEIVCSDNSAYDGACPGNSVHDQFARMIITPDSATTPFTVLWDLP